jgi:hypothetical protein
MLKRLLPERTEQDLSSLVTSRNAVHFLYEESIANGNADITALLGEALTCGDELIAERREISYRSKDALLYLFFSESDHRGCIRNRSGISSSSCNG